MEQSGIAAEGDRGRHFQYPQRIDSQWNPGQMTDRTWHHLSFSILNGSIANGTGGATAVNEQRMSAFSILNGSIANGTNRAFVVLSQLRPFSILNGSIANGTPGSGGNELLQTPFQYPQRIDSQWNTNCRLTYWGLPTFSILNGSIANGTSLAQSAVFRRMRPFSILNGSIANGTTERRRHQRGVCALSVSSTDR